MKIQFLQHVSFETPAYIRKLAKKYNCPASVTHIYKNESLPSVSSFDLLVIMGGPMNIYEHNKYPWFPSEKEFINESIKAGKKILGICLGAQLLADVLGGIVTRNNHKEIGWFPVKITESGIGSPLLKGIPVTFDAFHWHGDTFSIPPGAKRIASSRACENQGFIYKENIIGLQFHLETDSESIKKLVETCKDDITPGKFVNTSEQLISIHEKQLRTANSIMETLFYNICDISIGRKHGKSKNSAV